MQVIVIMHRQRQLLEMICTLHPTRRLTGGLHSGQEQSD
jgi:hypothetical protein